MAGLQDLVKKLADDKAFAESLSQLKTKEEILAKLKENGFELTEEDIAKLQKGKEGELSDEALEGAAGGFLPEQMFLKAEFLGNDKKFI